jgi:ATP-binding cassette, subfamily B, heavy metal transporter
MTQRSASDTKTLRTLLPYLWPRGRASLKARVVFSLGCLVAAKLVNVYVPFLYKRAVDLLSDEAKLFAVPVMLVVGYGVARLLHQVFGELRDAIFSRVAFDAQKRIAVSTFEHLHKLSLRFHLERRTGGLSRVIERGTVGIESLLTYSLFNIIPTIVEIGLVTGVLLSRYRPVFAIIICVTIVAYIAFTLLITDWRVKYRQEMNDRDTEANGKAIDSLLNYETVKYFNNEALESSRYSSSMVNYAIAAVKSQTTLSFLNMGQGGIIAAGLIAVMLAAAHGVVAKEMTVGDFVMVNTFLIQLYMPLNFLGYVYREIKQGLVNLSRMFELLHLHEEVADSPAAKELFIKNADVEFKEVEFSYQPERIILKNLSFHVPGGKTVAIVGPSGAGKSTVSRLLFRFYDVQKGQLLIDGQDLREITQNSLRRNIGIVPQDTVLFNDTIYYNILYGRPEASREEVIQAAKVAKIHTFIESLPDGYNSQVGERGLKLSGGEKQRVAIARTVLKNPPILIFDEATSALDSHTEREIQASLKEVSVNRTTLVIAHRLSTVVDADEILVLENGKIIERGTHPTLLANHGTYASMWAKQHQKKP